MSIAIKFENISKEYRLGLVSTQTTLNGGRLLSHDLNRWWQMNMRGKEDPYFMLVQLELFVQ